MKQLELFAGIGGFGLAAAWAGIETVCQVEIDPFCQKVLEKHFPNAQRHSDIKTFDGNQYRGTVDIVSGGFPCQPYSNAGKRLGKEDDRHLWPEMFRVIREVRPRYVVGENVAGIISWNGGVVFDEVQTDLENEGYEVWAFVLPACAVDAPHRRDRVWFIAYTNSKRCGQLLPTIISDRQGFGSIVCDKTTPNTTSSRRIQNNRETTPGQPTQNISDWRRFPTQSPVCGRNDGVPSRLAGITVPRHRRESIKGYGNAIVPHVAFQIFQAILNTEST